MSDLRLTLACGPYDRMAALASGAVKPDGIDLDCVAIGSPPELFRRMADGNEFDVAEMGASQHIRMVERGGWQFVALPVFPSKAFRHGFIFVNTKAGIAAPGDLEGKRVGVPIYGQAAAIWIRGILQHEYGVDIETLQWFRGGLARPAGPEDGSVRGMVREVPIAYIGADTTLDDMLVAGEIDAVIGAQRPPSMGRHADIARLFADVRGEERAYFARTGIHPIMHLIVIREDLYRDNPWIGESLYRAFVEAKDHAFDRIRSSGGKRYMLPWLLPALDEIDALFGGDPWPYGVEPNRKTLAAMIRYMQDQYFIGGPVPVDDLFVNV